MNAGQLIEALRRVDPSSPVVMASEPSVGETALLVSAVENAEIRDRHGNVHAAVMLHGKP